MNTHLKLTIMNKYLMYIVIGLVALIVLGYLVKAALKFIVFFGLIALVYFGYRYFKKNMGNKEA